MCEPYSGAKRYRSDSSSGYSSTADDSESDASSEPDREIETSSVRELYPQAIDFLNGSFCDIDQLVLHGYPVRSVVQDFSCDYFVFEPKMHPHRAFTDRAAASTRPPGIGYGINSTDLFLGTLGGYQVVVEKITRM